MNKKPYKPAGWGMLLGVLLALLLGIVALLVIPQYVGRHMHYLESHQQNEMMERYQIEP